MVADLHDYIRRTRGQRCGDSRPHPSESAQTVSGEQRIPHDHGGAAAVSVDRRLCRRYHSISADVHDVTSPAVGAPVQSAQPSAKQRHDRSDPCADSLRTQAECVYMICYVHECMCSFSSGGRSRRVRWRDCPSFWRGGPFCGSEEGTAFGPGARQRPASRGGIGRAQTRISQGIQLMRTPAGGPRVRPSVESHVSALLPPFAVGPAAGRRAHTGYT